MVLWNDLPVGSTEMLTFPVLAHTQRYPSLFHH